MVYLLLVLEVLLLIYILRIILINKKLNFKNSIVYFLFLIIGTVFITYSNYLLNNKFELLYILNGVNETVNLIKLSFSKAIFYDLRELSFIFRFEYAFLYMIAFFALFSLAISIFKVNVSNLIRLIQSFIKKNKELIIVYNLDSDSLEFLKNLDKTKRKNVIVILENKKYKNELVLLDSLHIKYLFSKYNEISLEKVINRLSKITKKLFVLYFIKDDNLLSRFIESNLKMIEKINNDGIYDKYRFIYYVDKIQDEFIKERIKGYENNKLIDKSYGMINTFDKYDLISLDFIWNHNLAKHMPRKYILDDCTIDDVDINLFMIGYGKINQNILNDTLINSQFLNKNLEKVKINTYIYDKANSNSNELNYGLFKYHKDQFNKELYYELIDDYYSNVTFNLNQDVFGEGFYNSIYENIHKNKNKQVNYFVIALGDDLLNSIVKDKIYQSIGNIEDINNIFFIRNKEGIKNNLKVNDEFNKFIEFGNDKSILSYDNLIMDKIYNLALIEASIYNENKEFDKQKYLEYRNLSRIKQKSNLYSVLSIPFKLSLLKLDFNVSEDEYLKIYDKYSDILKTKNLKDELNLRLKNQSNILDILKIKREEKYFKSLVNLKYPYSPRDVLAVIEHNRWNAFELSMGILPRKKSEVFDLENKLVKSKSNNELYHANITTQKGLVDYYLDVLEFEIKCQKEFDPDVIKYDFDLMDNLFRHINKYKKEE